jgi:hypothetical protein
MTIKQICKNDENGNMEFSKYFERNLENMMKVLAKRRKKINKLKEIGD